MAGRMTSAIQASQPGRNAPRLHLLRTAGKQPRRSSVVHGKPQRVVLSTLRRSPPRTAPIVVRHALALVVFVFSGGCRGCANDHPYVPPAVQTTQESASDGAAPVTLASSTF